MSPAAAHGLRGARAPLRRVAGPADYARTCVEAFVGGRPAPPPPADALYDRVAACFCSLKKHGELRGCIGTLTPAEPSLGDEIARNAYAAAFRDPAVPAGGRDRARRAVVFGRRAEPERALRRERARPAALRRDRDRGRAARRPAARPRRRRYGRPPARHRPPEGRHRPRRALRDRAFHRAAGSARPAATRPVAEPAGAAPLVALFGPTGMGKTEIAVALAERARRRDRLGRLDAGLPRPADRDQPAVAPSSSPRCRTTWSASSTRARSSRSPATPRLAQSAIDDVLARGRRVVVAGGSGLYLRAALGGLTFGGPPSRRPQAAARGARGRRPGGSARAPAARRPGDLRGHRRRQPAARRARPRDARRRPAAAAPPARDELWSAAGLRCADTAARPRRRSGAAARARRGARRRDGCAAVCSTRSPRCRGRFRAPSPRPSACARCSPCSPASSPSTRPSRA